MYDRLLYHGCTTACVDFSRFLAPHLSRRRPRARRMLFRMSILSSEAASPFRVDPAELVPLGSELGAQPLAICLPLG